MQKKVWVLVELALLLGLTASVAAAQPGRRRAAKAAPEPQLPQAVASAVASAFPGSSVADFEPDADDGVSVYSIELSSGEEVEASADGVILEVAYDSAMSQVPAAAAQALQNAGAGATLDEVQRVEVRAEIDGGKVVKLAQPRTEYSAIFKKGGKFGEISVAADGTVVDPMEWGVED
jgi:hypothetical protein